jgi:hypothetical protein
MGQASTKLMMILIMSLEVMSTIMMIPKLGSDESAVLPVACDDDDDDDVVGVCLLAHGFVWMMGMVGDLNFIYLLLL